MHRLTTAVWVLEILLGAPLENGGESNLEAAGAGFAIRGVLFCIFWASASRFLQEFPRQERCSSATQETWVFWEL